MYKGVAELMPYAKSVSAKSYDFDDNGNETKIDYAKMIKIIEQNNYDGYIGVEYERQSLKRKRRYFGYQKPNSTLTIIQIYVSIFQKKYFL